LIKQVKVSDVQYDLGNYPRIDIDEETVKEYQEAMKRGDSFPPIVVYDDGKKLYLADGAHRLAANKALKKKRIAAKVQSGSEQDALACAVGANAKHGLKRSSADKRKAVELILRDEKLRKRSINSIAKLCNVSWDTVRTVWNDKKQVLNLPDYNEPQGAEGGQTKKAKMTPPEKLASIESLSEAVRHTERARSWLLNDSKELGLDAGDRDKMLKELDKMHANLHRMAGEATGCKNRLTRNMRVPLNVYHFERKGGIVENSKFEEKELATHSVAVGLGCGNQCTYCSTAVMLRTHDFFQEINQTSFARGNAIVDPNSAERLAKNIDEKGWGDKLTAEHTILFSNIDDGWSPEAVVFKLGYKILKVLLEKTEANVRVLTKGAAVSDSFDLIEGYRDRVFVGLSTGIPKSKDELASIIEPNASTVTNRFKALKEAHDRGLRTFGMLCPCLPGIADSKTALREMFADVIRCGAKDIWLESVNPRGRAMKNTADALARAGKIKEAKKMLEITSSDKWSEYTLNLTQNAIAVAKERKVLDKLHILMYPSELRREHEEILRKEGDAIIWL
jgi:DNA repair photolyase